MGWRNLFLRQQILDLQKCMKRLRVLRGIRGLFWWSNKGEGSQMGKRIFSPTFRGFLAGPKLSSKMRALVEKIDGWDFREA